jgi:hypothetical protein
MIELPDPNGSLAPPSKADQQVYRVDCCRHPLLGCIIGYGNGPPHEQARNYLRSLRNATVHQTAGRAVDLSDAEFRDLWRRLEAWEAAGNTVHMPPRIAGHTTALGRDAEADRQAHMAEQYRIESERQQIDRNRAALAAVPAASAAVN